MELKREYKRIMGIDVGTKRIGIAISDPFCMFASQSFLVLREAGKDEKAFLEIDKIAKDNKVEKIVIGIPYNMDGSLGYQGKNCIEFSEYFKKDYEVIYEDERLTSEQSSEILKLKKKKYTKQKGLVDMQSASIILQQYLDR